MSLQTQNNGGSSTCVIELQPQSVSGDPSIKESPALSVPLSASPEQVGSIQGEDTNETLPSPTTAVERVHQWNNPKINIYRCFATFWCFTVMGLTDGAYGAIIPYLEEYYHLTYIVVSLVFLSPIVGYTLSAVLNNTFHLRFGQRGVAFVSSLCHLIAFVGISLHPPYPALVVIFIVAGFGHGLTDAAWNAWVGSMANANEVLGFLHGFYGLGATLGPTIATTLIAKAGLPWWYFYYVMIGFAGIELVVATSAFWTQNAEAFRLANPRTSDKKGNRMNEALFNKPAARVTWLVAFLLLCYVGAEVALGGWIVTFMIRVRKGTPFASGMTATGFWLGLTVGRFILGFITARIGVRLAVSIYLPLTMGLELLFWLVPQFYVSAIAVSFQGFFLGPIFPAAVVAATHLLPKHLHVSAIGFAAAFGGGGAAALPFAVGAIAQAKGVSVLQPIILAVLAIILGLWLCLPKMSKKRE